MMKRIALIVSLLAAQVALAYTPLSVEQMDSVAFEQVKEGISPLSSEQIRDLRQMYNELNRSQAYAGDRPAKPVSSSLVVDLAPGATPPVIRLGAGFVTSVVFLDATGQPWPIKAIDVGNPSLFGVQWNKSGPEDGDTMSNTLLIQAKSYFKEGNLAVILRGLNTPVMMTLIPGQRVVDYRVDAQVPRSGPNAKVEFQLQPSGANPLLLDVLNGIVPTQAKPVQIRGGHAQGWKIGKTLFLRSSHTVLSPGWYSTMSASDGTMHAYEMPLTASILLLENGQIRKISVEGT